MRCRETEHGLWRVEGIEVTSELSCRAGRLRVTLRWPEKRVQAIKNDMERLAWFVAFAASSENTSFEAPQYDRTVERFLSPLADRSVQAGWSNFWRTYGAPIA